MHVFPREALQYWAFAASVWVFWGLKLMNHLLCMYFCTVFFDCQHLESEMSLLEFIYCFFRRGFPSVTSPLLSSSSLATSSHSSAEKERGRSAFWSVFYEWLKRPLFFFFLPDRSAQNSLTRQWSCFNCEDLNVCSELKAKCLVFTVIFALCWNCISISHFPEWSVFFLDR